MYKILASLGGLTTRFHGWKCRFPENFSKSLVAKQRRKRNPDKGHIVYIVYIYTIMG